MSVCELGFSDVGGFRAFVGRHDVEFDRVIFREAFEAFALNRGEMHEHIRRAIFRSDEAEPFRVIEPLYFTFGSHVDKYLYCFDFHGVLGRSPRRDKSVWTVGTDRLEDTTFSASFNGFFW
jgi:hypothetical protein